MKHRLLRYISFGIILLFCLSLWSGMVRHVAIGGEMLGALSGPLKAFSGFPSKTKKVYEAITCPPETYLKIAKEERQEINKLDYDLFAINSFYNDDSGDWEIELFNFRNDSVWHRWELQEEDFEKSDYESFANVRPTHTFMLPDSSIVVSMFGSNSLVRFDKNSEVLWQNNELQTHHSVNPDHQGNLWVCTKAMGEASNKAIINFDGEKITFTDNSITCYDSSTGKILHTKAVSEILFDNDIGHLIFYNLETRWDPIHLNDIQPVLKDGPHWKKGDLFLSMRNISTVLLYRPSTGSVIWHRSHFPLLHQHDIDILSEDEISIFNNNHISNKFRGNLSRNYSDSFALVEEYSEPYSQMLTYNFKTDTFKTVLSDYFNQHQIGTSTEGLLEVTSRGDVYVESQNKGIMYVLNEEGIQMRKTFSTSIEGRYHMPNWVRIEPIK